MKTLHNGDTLNRRLTPKWTKTLEEAYGDIGKRARDAEVMMINEIKHWPLFTVLDLQSDKAAQMKGHDILIMKEGWRRPYSVDVKSNLHFGGFSVELHQNGWLFNPKKTSDRICHVDVNEGWWLMYDRNDMKKYLIGKTKTRILQKKTDENDIAKFPMSLWKSNQLPFKVMSGKCKG